MIYYCKGHQLEFLPEEIKQDLTQYTIVFNPSFLTYNRMQYWALRCYSEIRKEILAIVYIYNENSREFITYDLNNIFKDKFNIKPADPKLLRIDDKIYCTLNTGYSATVNNSVFLIEIANELVIKRCVIGKRNTVEKNWAFFQQDGKLKMLYSISPICKTYSLSSSSDQEMFFEEEKAVENNIGTLTIGPQPVLNNDKLYLVAHKKYSFLNKRIYLGVPVTINIKTLDVKKGSIFMVHSLLSMLGSRFKFNKNLISCTYFSGLQVDFTTQRTKLTYGINDVSWHSIEVNFKTLW